MILPEKFVARMTALCGEEWKEQAGDAYRALRINTLKCDRERLAEALPIGAAVPFCPDGFRMPADHKAGADPMHHAGAYYMQEPSAMSAVTVLAPKKGERVLDLCAAPGGKSTQIAAALDGTGLLWCNEFVASRARILLQNLERCGVRNAAVTSMDTAKLTKPLAGWFDAVLVDAPCSGEGMFRKEPDALAMWSEENVKLCAERGAYILDAAARAVRPGGRLLLSTCTFAPEENECQAAAFLMRHPDFHLLQIEADFGRPGFSRERVAPFYDGELPDVDLTYTRRIFPADGGEGHFLALFFRDGDERIHLPALRADKDETKVRRAMEAWTRLPEGIVYRVGDHYRLLPPEMPDVGKINLLAAGVPCAEICKNRLEPTHAWYMAYGEMALSRLDLAWDSPEIRKFLHGESIPCTQRGYVCVTVSGVPVGFGKADGTQLKNHYPKGLRLLTE